jgi:hypothetical protein
MAEGDATATLRQMTPAVGVSPVVATGSRSWCRCRAIRVPDGGRRPVPDALDRHPRAHPFRNRTRVLRSSASAPGRSAQDREVLELIAAEAGVAIENACTPRWTAGPAADPEADRGQRPADRNVAGCARPRPGSFGRRRWRRWARWWLRRNESTPLVPSPATSTWCCADSASSAPSADPARVRTTTAHDRAGVPAHLGDHRIEEPRAAPTRRRKPTDLREDTAGPRRAPASRPLTIVREYGAVPLIACHPGQLNQVSELARERDPGIAERDVRIRSA